MTTYKIPKKVKLNAEAALILKKLGFHGGTKVGIKRAEQLAYQERISRDDVIEMWRWFQRHKFTSFPGYQKWVAMNYPIDKKYIRQFRGAVSWLLWGGIDAYEWIVDLKNELIKNT